MDNKKTAFGNVPAVDLNGNALAGEANLTHNVAQLKTLLSRKTTPAPIKEGFKIVVSKDAKTDDKTILFYDEISPALLKAFRI